MHTKEMRHLGISSASRRLQGQQGSVFQRVVRGMLAVSVIATVASGASLQSASASGTTGEKDHVVTSASPLSMVCPPAGSQAVASPFHGKPDNDGFPAAAAWDGPPTATFCSDWRGQNSDPTLQTNVHVLWSSSTLYLRFQARYKDLNLYPEKNQHKDRLWLRDVAEVFLQPPGSNKAGYKELEVSPNGNWFAVSIISYEEEKVEKWKCDLKSKGDIDESQHIWTGELAIPMECLTKQFDPAANWRVNFFRIEGLAGRDKRETKDSHRFYSAWHPTNTERPFFHVPEVFGELKFASE